jgi:hypothetical protein
LVICRVLLIDVMRRLRTVVLAMLLLPDFRVS